MTATLPDTHDLDAFDYGTLAPRRQEYAGGDPAQSLRDLRAIVENAIVNHPRSLQKRIGPSEIGNPCSHCLAAKLAGWPQTADGVAWLPTIGTATHAWLEEQILQHEINRNAIHTTGRRWLTEERVTVGQLGGVDVTGSTDLVDLATGVVIDHKIVGLSTLRKVRSKGPSDVYRVQADLYAKGWNDAGVRVDHVAIAFYPRNSASLDDAIWWHAPHDRGRALDALARANRLHANLTALESISVAARDQWITALPRDPDCWDCARYPDQIVATADEGETLDGLILPAATRRPGTTKNPQETTP
jgi:hypothetical protein